jgi:hypothetical protein
MINYDRATKTLLLQIPDAHMQYAPHPGAVLQLTSIDFGETWSDPVDISKMLGPLFSPGNKTCGTTRPACLAVGPGAGIQLSAVNKFHPNRLIFAGHHGAYEYDAIWYSDDGGKTYELAKNASVPTEPAQIWHQDEIALAETPDGGVIASMRNEDYHKGYSGGSPKDKCNCRGVTRSTDGGSSFGMSVPARTLVGPVCQATMVSVPGAGNVPRTIFHANPGHGKLHNYILCAHTSIT